MKTVVFAALLFASTLTAGTAAAQPAPFNEIGVTMGHWHIVSKDVEANKKIFLAMGGKLFMPGGNAADHVPRRLHQFEPRDREGRWRHPGFGGEPCRLHRRQRPAAGRPVEGCRRAGAAGQQQPAGPGLRRDAGRRAHRNPGRQDAVDADPATNMSTSPCRKPKFPKLRPGMRRPSAARPALATTRRSWMFREVSSGSPRPTRSRRRREGACSTTSVST